MGIHRMFKVYMYYTHCMVWNLISTPQEIHLEVQFPICSNISEQCCSLFHDETRLFSLRASVWLHSFVQKKKTGSCTMYMYTFIACILLSKPVGNYTVTEKFWVFLLIHCWLFWLLSIILHTAWVCLSYKTMWIIWKHWLLIIDYWSFNGQILCT